MKRVLLLTIICFAVSQFSFAQSFDNKFWETDGIVNAVVKKNNKLFIGGKFNYVGPNTGSAVMFAGQNVVLNSNVKILGEVYAVARDASGKVYLGGDFESNGRKNLLVLNADGSLNNMNISVEGKVKTLYATENILLIGGSFESVANTSRLNCAAINTVNGQLLPLSPNPNGEVRAFTVAGPEIILGGSFTSVLNQTRNGLASISALSGTLQSLNNSVNGVVNCLNFDNGLLYVGGEFSGIDTFTRNNFAAINMLSNTVTPLNPDINGPVNAIEFNSNSIFAAGSFSSVGFGARYNLAEFDKLVGVLTNFNPAPSGEVKTLVLKNSTLYVGGDFEVISNNLASHFASISLTGGLISAPKFNGIVSGIAVASDTIIVGGSFTSFGGVERQNFACLDFNSGAVLNYSPNVNDEIKTMELYGNYLAIGGSFSSINTIDRFGFALLDTISGDPISITSNVSGKVNKILIIGNSAYLGGLFSNVNAASRTNLAKISLLDGSVDSWNYAADGEVTNLKSFGTYLYAMGKFSQISMVSRRGLARFVLSGSGDLDGWNPQANNDVYDLVQDKNTVYFGGAFNMLGESSVSSVAAVDTNLAIPVQGFNPLVNFTVGALAYDGDVVFAASNSTEGLTAFHAANSSTVNFNFSGNFNTISQLNFIDDYLFVSGNYKLNKGNYRNNFSAILMSVNTPDQSASNIQFANVSPVGMTLYFNKGNGSKHLVIGKQGSIVDGSPSNGVDYSASAQFGLGSSIGSGNFILSNSSDTVVEISGLNIGTNYYFSIYEANGIGTFVKYQSSTPATASQATIQGYNPPTVSASSLMSKEIRTNTMRLGWTKGNGMKRVVVAKESSAVNAIPTDSTSLTASSNFGDGYNLGNDNFIVYNGDGDSCELFNLKAGTTYHFAVYEYNGIDAFARVKTDNPAVGSFTCLVPSSEPTEASSNISFSEIGTSSLKVSWTSGNGAGRIIIASESADLFNTPKDGEVYFTDGNFSGNSYSFSNSEKVVYIGTGNNCTITGLNPGSIYYIGVFEFNGSDFTINYLENSPAKSSVKMKIPGNPPLNPSKALSFTRVASDSLYMRWINGIGEGRVVFVKKGGLPSVKPVSGVSYRADVHFGMGDSLSDGSFAIYDGNADEAFVANLEPNTIYGVEVFDYNNGDFGKTYQVDSFAFGLKSTLPLSGLKKSLNENQIHVFPMPAGSEINIEFEKSIKGKVEIRIFDLQGRVVHEMNSLSGISANQTLHLDLSGLDGGNYLLHISNGKEFLAKSIIISK